MKQARRLLGLTAVLLLGGCGRQPLPAGGAYRSADSARALVSRVVAAMDRGRESLPCRTATRDSAFSHLIVVSARACLSCRGIGSLLRRATWASTAPPLVVFPASDSAEVCPFLVREHIPNPVVALPEDILPADRLGSTVVIGSLDSLRRITAVLYGKDVVDLLPSLDSVRSATQEAPQSSSTGGQS